VDHDEGQEHDPDDDRDGLAGAADQVPGHARVTS
jgi:hypothetical protein